MPNFWLSISSKPTEPLFGRTLRRESQTRFGDLVGRNEDRAAAVGQLVRNIGLLEGGDDRAAVAVRQIAVEHLDSPASATTSRAPRQPR